MNECLDDALSELSAVGIKPEVFYGGKHIRLHWRHNGELRSHTVPMTPSDWRSGANNRAQIRGTLKRDGLLGTTEEPSVDLAHVVLRGGEPFVSSLDIARHFGKAHKDVLRAVDRIIEETGDDFGRRNFTPSSYINEQSREFRFYEMTRDGFSFLVMGFTGPAATQWKLRYIEAFNAMEAEIKRAATSISLPADIAERVQRLEADLKALVDLSLGGDAEPGFIYVKAHKRRVRGAAA